MDDSINKAEQAPTDMSAADLGIGIGLFSLSTILI